ncbi:MAG: hypothetical protein PHX34_04555 [Candidatus Shapirobacteria bacterium]|nr:hypothetical protein [Candidatus Shapirobacteria bacterium]
MKRIEFLDLVEEYFPKIEERKRIRINEDRKDGWTGLSIRE